MSCLFLEDGGTLIDASSSFCLYKAQVYFPCTAFFSNHLKTTKLTSFNKSLVSPWFICLLFEEHALHSQSETDFLSVLAGIASVAKYVLVVEKETGESLFTNSLISCSASLHILIIFCIIFFVAVFQRLANDKFCERNHCIVITVSMHSSSPFCINF